MAPMQMQDLYGSTQSYGNPSWLNRGQTYAQPSPMTDAYLGKTQQAPVGIDNGMAHIMSGGAGYTPPPQIPGPPQVPGTAYTGGSPNFNEMTGQYNPGFTPDGSKTPMASQPGIDESRLYNGTWNPNSPPIFNASDITYRPAQAGTPGGAFSGQGASGVGQQWNAQTAAAMAPQAAGWNTPGSMTGRGSNWDINFGQNNPSADAFNLAIKNSSGTAQNYGYTKDPTGKYWVPSQQGTGINMDTNRGDSNRTLLMLAATAATAGGAAYYGAPAAGVAGASAEGAAAGAPAYMGVGSTAGSGAGAGFGAAEGGGVLGGLTTGDMGITGGLGGGLEQAGAGAGTGQAPGYMGPGSSAATGGGDIAAQGGYAQGTESLMGNAGEVSSMTPQQLAQYYQQGRGVVNAVNGGGGNRPTGQSTGNSMTNPDGSINWGNLLSGVGGAAYNYNQQDRYASAMKDMYTQATQRAQPFLDRLNQSYTDPSSYLKGPEYSAIKDIEQNRIDRQASAQGRLSNPTDRDVLMQKFAMQNLSNYRQGLAGTAENMFSTAGRMAPMFQSGATADAARGAGAFGLLGQGGTNGGIPWQQLGQAGSDAWQQYGPQISDWFGGWFGGE